jgi:hypothetical protein
MPVRSTPIEGDSIFYDVETGEVLENFDPDRYWAALFDEVARPYQRISDRPKTRRAK